MKKPLTPGLVKPLIKAISLMLKEQIKFKEFITEKKPVLEKFTLFKCSINTLEEAKEMAEHLALYFTDPGRASKGIYQLLENAVEHGNLEIGYDAKTDLIKEGKWLEEIQIRNKDKDNKKKAVEIVYERKKDGSYIQITDTGKGFDWKKFMEIDPSRASHIHGRGVSLANKIYFDKLMYNQQGNQVTAFLSAKKRRINFWG